MLGTIQEPPPFMPSSLCHATHPCHCDTDDHDDCHQSDRLHPSAHSRVLFRGSGSGECSPLLFFSFSSFDI